ncbi:hypothetical protein M8J77_022384 [Diaphorina citri]|nr:hypothetical protein M8J77_002802 [Diaphorina citri]KAI5752978.1 hypothetical protein M8J77_022384 [Diaphorina citri]
MGDGSDGDPGGGPPTQNTTTQNTNTSNEKHLVLYKPGMKCDLFKLIIQLKPNSVPTFSANGKRTFRYIRGVLLSKLLAEITNKSQDIVEIRRLNRSKFLVACTTSKCANEIVQNEKMKEQFMAYIPVSYTSRAAIIRDVDLEITDEEILENLDSGDFKVTHMQRLNRRTFVDGTVSYVPSTTVKLVFEGQDMPSFVYLWYSKLTCEPYVQNPIQCFSCYRYGHVTKYCKNKKLCRKCFHEIEENEEDHVCNAAEVKCLNCNGMHNANSKSCPEYERQRNIKILMSTRSLCFPEANALIPRDRDTFAVRTKNSFAALEKLNSEDTHRNNYSTEFPELRTNKPKVHRNITKYVAPPLSNVITRSGKRKPETTVSVREENAKKNKHMEEMRQMTKPETYYKGNEISKMVYKGCQENKEHKANNEHQQWLNLTHPDINCSATSSNVYAMDETMFCEDLSVSSPLNNIENAYQLNDNRSCLNYPGSPDLS